MSLFHFKALITLLRGNEGLFYFVNASLAPYTAINLNANL